MVIQRDLLVRAAGLHPHVALPPFDYLWRRLAISVSSTWSLMRLTFIAAAFITAYGFFPTWEYFLFGDRNSNDTIAGVTVMRVGTVTRLTLSPVTRTMLVDETATVITGRLRSHMPTPS